jgi:hypothetical protein
LPRTDRCALDRRFLPGFEDAWREAAGRMRNGVTPVDITFGPPEKRSVLAHLLHNRADVLSRFAEDDSFWGI